MEDTPVYHQPATTHLARYITHKVVHAARIEFIMDCPGDSVDLLLVGGGKISVTRDWVQKRGAQPGGYYIVYVDGYTSWSPAEAFEASAMRDDQWGLPRQQEPKYTVSQRGRLVNRHTGKPIPDDEPVFTLRAQDLDALPTLAFYRDRLPLERRRSVEERILAFGIFRETHPGRVTVADGKPPIPPVPTSIKVGASE